MPGSLMGGDSVDDMFPLFLHPDDFFNQPLPDIIPALLFRAESEGDVGAVMMMVVGEHKGVLGHLWKAPSNPKNLFVDLDEDGCTDRGRAFGWAQAVVCRDFRGNSMSEQVVEWVDVGRLLDEVMVLFFRARWYITHRTHLDWPLRRVHKGAQQRGGV